MKVRKTVSGELLYHESERNGLLSIIAEGTISLKSAHSEGNLSKGCLLGIPQEDSVYYPFDCTATSAVTLYQYDYSSYEDLYVLLEANKDASGLIAACFSQGFSEQLNAYSLILSSCQLLYDTICEEYAKYKILCKDMNVEPKELPGINQLSDFNAKSEISDWTIDYYTSLGTFAPTKWKAFYESDYKASAGFIIKAGKDLMDLLSTIRSISIHLDMICDLVVSEYKIDLFTFYLELFEFALKENLPYADVSAAIARIIETVEQVPAIDPEFARGRFSEYKTLLPKQAPAKNSGATPGGLDPATVEKIKDSLNDSLSTILEYAEIDPESSNKFTSLIHSYIETPDRSASDDNTRLIRRNIAALFYEIYKKAFFKSINDPALPTELKMFFYFGYVDSRLSGSDNAVILYMLSEQLLPDTKNSVFTFYDWLKLIYSCDKDPCVNEFNEDYTAMLHKMKVEKKISDSEEASLLRNGVKRVSFEIDNMFKSVSKIISGHITTFCPVFSDHDLYRPLESILLKYGNIHTLIDKIRMVDFSLFYRETTYTAPEIGIQKEFIQVEVLPDFILMPGCGTRGAMWQEITGRRRTSPARFALPIFLMEDLTKAMFRLCGEFRWELCRRIQGARWNDLGERSLTADYCDYLDTYKRSKDLTPEAKDKIKSAYAKYRNSSKEMFVHDYVDYMMYESSGSLRLNKLTRTILFTYCPFSKQIREQISSNQLYKEIIEKYNIKHSHTLHLSDLSIQKIQKSGVNVPDEIKAHRRFLEM